MLLFNSEFQELIFTLNSLHTRIQDHRVVAFVQGKQSALGEDTGNGNGEGPGRTTYSPVGESDSFGKTVICLEGSENQKGEI